MGELIVVGLPIGNIEDISIRSLRALFSSDVILAEDTRNYLKIKSILKERFAEILKLLDINAENRPDLVSYREQNHKRVTPQIIKLIRDGKTIGLISDAGMPAISDPGFRLIEEILNAGLKVDVIPGPTAIESALVLSGLPTDRFTFLGFLPREKGKIKKLAIEHSKLTTIVYESPYRILKTLEVIAEVLPEVRVAACNDLTKKFQKVWRGNVREVIEQLSKTKVQGEWVLVIGSQRS